MGHATSDVTVTFDPAVIMIAGAIYREAGDLDLKLCDFRHIIPRWRHDSSVGMAWCRGFDPFDSYVNPRHRDNPAEESGMGLRLRALQRLTVFLQSLRFDKLLIEVGAERMLDLNQLGFTPHVDDPNRFQFDLHDEASGWRDLLLPPHWDHLPTFLVREWMAHFALQGVLPEIYRSPLENADNLRERIVQTLGACAFALESPDPDDFEIEELPAIEKVAAFLLAMLNEHQNESEFSRAVWSDLAAQRDIIIQILDLAAPLSEKSDLDARIRAAVAASETLTQLARRKAEIMRLI